MEEYLIKLAIEKFIEHELKDPDSMLRKKIDSILHGDNDDPGSSGGSGGSGRSGGSDQRSEEDIQREVNRYKRTVPQMIVDNVLPTVATGIETAGKAYNIDKSLLGEALLRMNHTVSNADAANKMDFSRFVPAAGYGKKAKGGIVQTITDGTAKAIRDIGNDVRHEREKDKQVELLIRERPAGAYIDSRRKLTPRSTSASSQRSSTVTGNSNYGDGLNEDINDIDYLPGAGE